MDFAFGLLIGFILYLTARALLSAYRSHLTPSFGDGDGLVDAPRGWPDEPADGSDLRHQLVSPGRISTRDEFRSAWPERRQEIVDGVDPGLLPIPSAPSTPLADEDEDGRWPDYE